MRTKKSVRKTSKRTSKRRSFTRKQKGGAPQLNVAFVRKGTYGCTFRPPFNCADNSQPGRAGYVSKLMAPEKAREEYQIGQPLLNINKTQAYTLPAIHQCRVKPSSIAYADGRRIPSINACRNTHLADTNKKDPLEGIRTAAADLLFYKDGGQDLEKIATYKHQIRPFFRGLQNLFDGLAILHANNYVHLDIKPPNVTVEVKGVSFGTEEFIPRFIDFGLGSKIEDWLKHLLRDVEPFPADAIYMYWPPELHYLQEKSLFGSLRQTSLDSQLATMRTTIATRMKNKKNDLDKSPYYVSPRVLYNASGQRILENVDARDSLYDTPFSYFVGNKKRNDPNAQAFRDWIGEDTAERARQWFAQFTARRPTAADLDFSAQDEGKGAVLEVLGKILKGVDMWSMGFILAHCLHTHLGFKPLRNADGSLGFTLHRIQGGSAVRARTPFIEEFFREAIKPAYELIEGLSNLDYKTRLTAEQAREEYRRVNTLLATYMKRPEFDEFITLVNGYRVPGAAPGTPATPPSAAAVPLPPSPSPHQLNYGVAENYGENIGGLFANAPAAVKPGRIVRGDEEDIEIFGKNIGSLFENAPPAVKPGRIVRGDDENFGQNIGGLFINAPEAPPGAVYPVRPGAAPAPVGARPPLRRSGRAIRKITPL